MAPMRSSSVKRGAAFRSWSGCRAPSLADELRIGTVKFHLARCIRAIAELVLQTQDLDRIALTIRRPSRHQKTAQTFRRLRENQESIAHRRRHEPFVAMQAEDPVACRLARVLLVRRSEPPWFSVIPMPRSAEVFSVQDESRGHSHAKKFAATIRPQWPAHDATSARSHRSSRSGNKRRFRSARACKCRPRGPHARPASDPPRDSNADRL